MVALKLAKLPDRTPVKLAITLAPDLKRSLDDYAELYRETYGHSEAVVDLIPHMLAAFLSSDRAFSKARETLGGERE